MSHEHALPTHQGAKALGPLKIESEIETRRRSLPKIEGAKLSCAAAK